MDIQYKIIEVEKLPSGADFTKEDEDSLKTLSNHPGAMAYLKKANIMLAMVRAAYESENTEFNRAMVAAMKWVVRSFKDDTKQAVSLREPRDLYQTEQEAFDSIKQAISLVGQLKEGKVSTVDTIHKSSNKKKRPQA